MRMMCLMWLLLVDFDDFVVVLVAVAVVIVVVIVELLIGIWNFCEKTVFLKDFRGKSESSFVKTGIRGLFSQFS